MPRVRFGILSIMIVIAALAVLMIPVRFMVSLDPLWLEFTGDLVIWIGVFSIVFITPFIGLTIALWLAILQLKRKL